MENVTAETAESVTTSAPAEEPVSTPETGEVSQASEGQGEAQTENLPFGKHPRWKRMVSENQSLKKEMETLKSQVQGLDGPRALHERITQNPKFARVLMDLMDEQRSGEVLARLYGQEKPASDPYEQYAPEVAEKFRRLDQLEQNFQQREQQEKERYLAAHRESIEGEFASLVKGAGFLSESGDYNNPELGDLIQSATLTAVTRIAKDPQFPTKEELKTAFETVTKGLSAYEKQTLKKAVKPSGVPASGSANGKVPSAKPDYTNPENRIARLASLI